VACSLPTFVFEMAQRRLQEMVCGIGKFQEKMSNHLPALSPCM